MTTTTVTESVEQSIRTSHLLFNPSPDISEWQTTRALSPEIVAFKNDDADFRRLAIEFYERGEIDEDGYEYTQDTWSVVPHDPYLDFEEMKMHHSREDAIEHVIEIMETVTGART